MYSMHPQTSGRHDTGTSTASERLDPKRDFTEKELRHDAPLYCGAVISNLPEARTLFFVEQRVDPTASDYRLALGTVRLGYQAPVHVWAYITSDNEVEIRCSAHALIPLHQYEKLELLEPFCYVETWSDTFQNTALEAVILWYFVTDRKWSPWSEDERFSLSLPALKQACEQVARGIIVRATASCDHMDWESNRSQTNTTMTESSVVGSSQKRKHDDQGVDKPPGKRAATASRKAQLEAELELKKQYLNTLSAKVRKAVHTVEYRSWLRGLSQDEKNTSEAALVLDTNILDDDIEGYEAILEVFRERYGMEL